MTFHGRILFRLSRSYRSCRDTWVHCRVLRNWYSKATLFTTSLWTV